MKEQMRLDARNTPELLFMKLSEKVKLFALKNVKSVLRSVFQKLTIILGTLKKTDLMLNGFAKIVIASLTLNYHH